MLGLSAMSSRLSSLRGYRDAFSSTACLIQLFRLTPCAVAESAARWCRSGPSRRLRVPENGFFGSTPSSRHDARYSSIDRWNSRRMPSMSVASNVAMG